MTTIQHLAKNALPQHQGSFEEMDNNIDEIGKSINEDKNMTLEDVLEDQGVEFAEEMESFKETKDKRFFTSYRTGTRFFYEESVHKHSQKRLK